MQKVNSILKSILLKKKQLTNFAEQLSKHDFYEIFPKDEFDFSNTNYKQYFYFGKDEAKGVLEDYFLLLKYAYNCNTFSYEHFVSIVNEFFESLESENVFHYYKTYYGHKILNNNINGFVLECKKLLNIDICEKQNAGYNEFYFPQDLQLKKIYNFPFFDFLTRKIKGTLICDGFVLEPLLYEDCAKIQDAYLKNSEIKNAPFYLNNNSKYYKYVRPKISECILSMLPKEKAWSVVTNDGREVCIFLLSPNDNGDAVLEVICDCDYLDSKLFNAIEVIKDYAFTVMGAKKIIGKNNNESIAYSNVTTAYSMSKFEPDFSTAVGENGLTRVEYVYKLVKDDINPLVTLTPIKPISYATFSVYNKK